MKKWPLMKAVCDKCNQAHDVLIFYALKNELLCLSCAGGPERTMTIQQLLVAITDAATSMTPEEKAEFRKALDGEREQDDQWMAHHWHNRRNPDVLSLDDSDYKFLRELKVKP